MSPLSVVLRVEERVQRTAKLAADWQLQSKKKTWNMLGFSTSLQTTPRGSIVNFNGLFSLETWLLWCVCVRRCCVCYFFKSVGHQSCSRSVWAGGLKLGELVGFFFYFYAMSTSAGHTWSCIHTYTETHLRKAKHEGSFRQMLSFQVLNPRQEASSCWCAVKCSGGKKPNLIIGF